MLEVVRALNNNVVWARSTAAGTDVIVVGRGLGFPPLSAALARDDPRIEKTFVFVEPSRLEQWRAILGRTEPEILGAVEESLTLAAKLLDAELPEQAHVAIADHLTFAITRQQQGIVVPNPFLTDIRLIYAAEYHVAEAMLRLIETRADVPLPEDEAGFLALHLAAAQQGQSAKRLSDQTRLIRAVVDVVKERYAPAAKADDLAIARLAVHLRHLVENLEAGRTTTNPLLDSLRGQFADTMHVAAELADIIAAGMGRHPGPDETGYLAIHLLKLHHQHIPD